MSITNSQCHLVLLALMIASLPVDPSAAADVVATISAEAKIAGMTIADCQKDLGSDDRVKRTRAIRTLGVFDQAAGQTLRMALEHDDPAVRYLAATNLGRIGGESLAQSVVILKELVSHGQHPPNDTPNSGRETHPQPDAVRLAAAYALCEFGLSDQYLKILTAAGSFPDRGTACSAADLIGRIGPEAAAAKATLEVAYEKNKPGVKGGDYHVGGAAMNALRKIRNP